MPSNVKATPKTSPNVAIHSGQRMPSSKERIVPETAPTAKSTIITLDQRLAIAL